MKRESDILCVDSECGKEKGVKIEGKKKKITFIKKKQTPSEKVCPHLKWDMFKDFGFKEKYR